MRTQRSWALRVHRKPEGWTVADGAAKVHGITTEIALAQGPADRRSPYGFDALLAQASMLIAFNIRFDDKLLRGERRRLGPPTDSEHAGILLHEGRVPALQDCANRQDGKGWLQQIQDAKTQRSRSDIARARACRAIGPWQTLLPPRTCFSQCATTLSYGRRRDFKSNGDTEKVAL